MIKNIIDKFGIDFFISSLTTEQINEYDLSKSITNVPEHFKLLDTFSTFDDIMLLLFQNGMLYDVDVSSDCFLKKINLLMSLIPAKDMNFDFDSKNFQKLILTHLDVLEFKIKHHDMEQFSDIISPDELNELVFKMLDGNSIFMLSKCSKVVDENLEIERQREMIYSVLCDNKENVIKNMVYESLIDVKMLNSISTYDILKQYGFNILKNLHKNNTVLVTLFDGSTKYVKIYPICNNRYMKELIEM